MDKKLIINLILTFIAIVFIIAIIGMNAKNTFGESPNHAYYYYTFILSCFVGILHPITSFIYYKTEPIYNTSLGIARPITDFQPGLTQLHDSPPFSTDELNYANIKRVNTSLGSGGNIGDSLRKRNP